MYSLFIAADVDFQIAQAQNRQMIPGLTQRSKEKIYKFSSIFQKKPTEEVFKSVVEPQVSAVFEGQNSCVFAFGATGSGKTYTMFGGTSSKGREPGIIELSLEVGFH